MVKSNSRKARSHRRRVPEIEVKFVVDDTDLYVVVDGLQIARRGYPGTSQAGTWVSLEPGWEVVDDKGKDTIGISYKGSTVH